uniref:BTB domain-containing protein n=1 Tax=Panagrellus redivivus TaxID=6233 RepID=A0A7E4WD85_PANRE
MAAEERIGFRYVWPVRVVQRQLNHNEAIILHVSPKFATVYDHVSFQWSVKMHGSANLDSDDDSADDLQGCADYIAMSLYYVDGPIPNVDVHARVDVLASGATTPTNPKTPNMNHGDSKPTQLTRGRETELLQGDRATLSAHIKDRIGKIVRFCVWIEIDARLFTTDRYLNAVSPTPVHSFLTANYRARVRSKVWRKKSSRCLRKPRNGSASDKAHLEQTFNIVMERERERRELETALMSSSDDDIIDGDSPKKHRPKVPRVQINAPPDANEKREHLFKKLLVACCDTCERRASLGPSVSADDEDSDASDDSEDDCDDDMDDDGVETTFECLESNKSEMHDTLATMYFNKVALPNMEYVEDFADFLIDAELNDLPVLKRACERYLCGELNSKRDLLTSLLLDLLFLAMMFQLPVMKSMTLTELADRCDELGDVNVLLREEEYQKLDKRIRQMSDRTLGDLVDECKKFREQRRRVEVVKIATSTATALALPPTSNSAPSTPAPAV